MDSVSPTSHRWITLASALVVAATLGSTSVSYSNSVEPMQLSWNPESDQRYVPEGDKSDYGATWVLHLLPPVGSSCDTFDASLLEYLDIRICQPGTDGTCNLVDQLTAAEWEIHLYGADGGDDDRRAANDCGHYRFEWTAPGSLVSTPLEIQFRVAGLLVDRFRYVPTSTRSESFPFRVNDHPRIRARVLREQGADTNSVADELIEEFDLGSLEIVRTLSDAGYGIVGIGTILLGTYAESPVDSAWLLKVSGYGAADAALLLRDVYATDVFDAAEILREIGYPCLEIGEALRGRFDVDSQVSLQALAAIDCAPDADCFFEEDDVIGDDLVATSLVESLQAVIALRLPGHGDHDSAGNGSDDDSPFPTRFDGSLLEALQVTIVVANDDVGRPAYSFTGGELEGQIQLKPNFYQLMWRPDYDSRNKLHEIRFSVAGMELLTQELFVETRRMVPLKFRVDHHPVIRAHVLAVAGVSATEIVTRLVEEFGLDVAAVAKILYEELFIPAELGQALRDSLAVGAAELAAALNQAGLPATFALEALDATFILPLPEKVSTLRVAGYLSTEVWRALEVVLDLDDGAIEELLRSGGYGEEEILLALAPRLLAKSACLIDRSGPKIYFHPLEPFLPSSIDWFMDVSSLAWGYSSDQECDGCRLPPGAVNRETLVPTVEQIRSEVDPELTFWFDVPEPDENPIARPGNLDSARTYVHLVRLRDLGVTDLQFWIYYPYNGPGSFRPSSNLFGLGNVCDEDPNYGNVAPLGEHESDWEVVVLRFDDTTNELLEVYLSAHGDYLRYPVGQIEFEEGHVVVYSALNGHAMFPHAGANPHREFYLNLGIGDVALKTLNWAQKGQALQAWQRYEIMALDSVFIDAPWLAFDGVWGETVEFDLTDGEKVGIIRAAADDCMLAIRFVHIPIASATLCAGICAVACAPAALFFGVGYGACFAACAPACTVAVITAANIALDPLLDRYGPDLLDLFFEDQKGTGKDTPASRGEEWRHFRLPNEDSRIIEILDTGDTDAPSEKVIVEIPDQVCERKDAKWLLGSPLCVDSPEIGTVELGIDGEYFDITDTAQRVKTAVRFEFPWDPAQWGGGDHVLSPRYSSPDGLSFEYTKGFLKKGPGDPVVEVVLVLEQDVIGEGGTAVLHGTVSGGGAPHELAIDWGDGSVETTSSATDDFVDSHYYADDGLYPIAVSVGDGVVEATGATRLVVGNLPPEVGEIQLTPAAPSLILPGTPVEASASFTDPGIADTHGVEWDWGDGSATTDEDVTSPVTASHTFGSAGVRTIGLTVGDDDLGVGRSSIGPLVISSGNQTAGAGSVLAPVVELPTGEATFTLDVATNASDETIVDFEFMIGGLVFDDVQQSLVTYSENRVEFEGGVSINGEPSASNGMPYQLYVAATDGPDTLQLRLWYMDNGVPILAYEIEPAEPLLTGDIVVDEVNGTTGNGSIAAPVVDDLSAIDMAESSFGFVVLTGGTGEPAVEFDFRVGGLQLVGVTDPLVTITGNRVEIEGGILVGGEALAANGNPYRVRITATDGPDTFQVAVTYLDGSGAERVYYQTDADQELLSGDVRVLPPPALEPARR